ncbi:transmembrane and coiled-coil domain-containing protein 6-like [Erethizon dorsatum]
MVQELRERLWEGLWLLSRAAENSRFQADALISWAAPRSLCNFRYHRSSCEDWSLLHFSSFHRLTYFRSTKYRNEGFGKKPVRGRLSGRSWNTIPPRPRAPAPRPRAPAPRPRAPAPRPRAPAPRPRAPAPRPRAPAPRPRAPAPPAHHRAASAYNARRAVPRPLHCDCAVFAVFYASGRLCGLRVSLPISSSFTMWSQRQSRLRRVACGVEELRSRRREREAGAGRRGTTGNRAVAAGALRKARREQQLVSKRLLREAPEEAAGQGAATILGEAEIQQFLRLAQQGTEEKEREKALATLRQGLQHVETQQTFIRLEGSMRTLVGLLTCNRALLQLEAARCLHELSHSEQSAVAEACLPATSYLLTYLSGHSSDFIELCLYTLGNLIVESEAVRRQLLPQGIVPALASCIQSPHMAVLEAVGYALSQLLQAKEAPEEIIP